MAINGKPRKIEYETWSKPELIREIKKLEKRKKYGIVWDEERTKEIFEEEVQHKLPVLNESKTKKIITDSNKPSNILIEGDNYHTLSVLNYTHHRKIDVVYIDPPYNTGNNDFIYNDRFVDKEDAYRHSKWLSFMSKRLRLVRNLLKKDGIFFTTIDDNEYAQLKLLCDEIFGETNYISTIIWQKVYSPKNQSKRISVDHEYVLAYAKNIEFADFNLLPRTEKMNKYYKNPDNDHRGPWASGDLVANEERKNGHYIITGPKGDEFDAPSGKHWAYSEENMKKLFNDNRLWFGKNETAFPRIKQFLSEVQQGKKPSTIFLHDEAGHSDEGKKELKSFFEQSENLFSTPKPTRLIKQLLRLCMHKDATVVDFMAGSGTTGHAVLSLNKEDGGNRRFILCTNNEGNICTDVCYPRLKKVIKGYENSKKQKISALGGNLQYFKTDFVSFEPTDQNKKNMVEKSTEMLCLKEHCFDLIKDGRQYKIFKNHENHYLGIIYYYDGIEPFKKEIAKLNKKITTYVFSLSDTIDEDEFREVDQLVDLKPIPSSILNVYRRIFAYVQTKKLPREAYSGTNG
jgi:adenine-specific DNA-methyltransferase